MTTLNQLMKLGLSDKESAVYLALLELGPSPVTQVAKKSGLKRPTTYVILEKLVQSGLAQESQENLGSQFKASNPLVISERIQRRLQLVRERKKLLPPLITQLGELTKQGSAQPVVKLYEGFNGNSLLVEELHGTGHISFFGDSQTFKEILLNHPGHNSNLQEVTAVVLTNDKKEAASLAKSAHNTPYAMTITPILATEAELGHTSIVINDQRLFVFNDYPTGDGIIIENADIISTCKQLFPYVLRGAKQAKPLAC